MSRKFDDMARHELEKSCARHLPKSLKLEDQRQIGQPVYFIIVLKRHIQVAFGEANKVITRFDAELYGVLLRI